MLDEISFLVAVCWMTSGCYLHMVFVRYINTTGGEHLLYGQSKSWSSAGLIMVVGEQVLCCSRVRDDYDSICTGKMLGMMSSSPLVKKIFWKDSCLGAGLLIWITVLETSGSGFAPFPVSAASPRDTKEGAHWASTALGVPPWGQGERMAGPIGSNCR